MPESFDSRARDLFYRIAQSCGLIGGFTKNPPVEVMFEIPQQAGLKFDLTLSLQNLDELHFYADRGWQFSFFPYEMWEEKYYDSVVGFISGQNRVSEKWRNGKLLSARLQGPDPDNVAERVDLAFYTKVSLPWFGTKKQIIKNSMTGS